jgi:BolA protein
VTRSEKIKNKLAAAFQPHVLEVVDESEAHRGHAGYQEGGESHFRVVIASAYFAEMGRITRHRAVHAAIGPALMAEIHALALQIDA